MKPLCALLFLLIISSCGSPAKKQNKIIGDGVPADNEVVIKKPPRPEGAIVANFNGDSVPFYSYVKNVDTVKAITTIAFEGNQFPEINIPKSYGAVLDTLQFKGIDRDLLLATAKLKDTSFNKYFLYKLHNNQWKPVVNGFAIHKSNRPDTLRPIRIAPKDSTKVIRYYSVFDLDKNSETGYRWKLLRETIPMEN
ncbi:hypothetical protein [Marixanthomonas spongiae]|uniref:Lipoprotein n=1 Tax=Marixanthomonas spongiae TaxID=2174845 RepID=A0A2U0I850_9FLAO|nr:hypothetical protein [Marixanthomonas spongiae]PVW17285.1 hypothetical protein DDV96_01890 [Marixanthomonas spongiae]